MYSYFYALLKAKLPKKQKKNKKSWQLYNSILIVNNFLSSACTITSSSIYLMCRQKLVLTDTHTHTHTHLPRSPPPLKYLRHSASATRCFCPWEWGTVTRDSSHPVWVEFNVWGGFLDALCCNAVVLFCTHNSTHDCTVCAVRTAGRGPQREPLRLRSVIS